MGVTAPPAITPVTCSSCGKKIAVIIAPDLVELKHAGRRQLVRGELLSTECERCHRTTIHAA